MLLKFVILSLFMLVHVINSHEDEEMHSIQYNEDNFDIEVPKKNHFIMFYAPWCGHCQRLSPIWEQLAEMLNEDEDSRIRIARFDCTKDVSVCSKHFITGYPTLKFFKVGEKFGIKFRGTRDLPTLSTFINEQLSNTEDEKVTISTPEVINGPKELTEDNFYDTIEKNYHFVKFYASWCGHCQNLAPTWDALAKSFQSDSNVVISKIDCTTYGKICSKFEIKGYPTLLWIENGKKVDKYTGQRTYEDLKTYVTDMLGKNVEANDKEKEDSKEIFESVMTLTSDNFEEGISKGISFVKFFAPWCGHCKRLAPTWIELGKKFETNENVNVIKVDCTNDASKKLCNEQEVDGFPTLLLYENGKKVTEYYGSRLLDDLHDYVMNYLNKKHDEL